MKKFLLILFLMICSINAFSKEFYRRDLLKGKTDAVLILDDNIFSEVEGIDDFFFCNYFDNHIDQNAIVYYYKSKDKKHKVKGECYHVKLYEIERDYRFPDMISLTLYIDDVTMATLYLSSFSSNSGYFVNYINTISKKRSKALGFDKYEVLWLEQYSREGTELLLSPFDYEVHELK